jgi:type IV secretion system protein VirD4
MRGIRLGYTKDFRDIIRYEFQDGRGGKVPGQAHLITVAPTGSGKGRDVLVPALLDYEGSCIVIDPKGQLAAITRQQRERMGQRIIVLNPFNILPEYLGPSARFNPLATLDPTLDSFGTDCDNIADAIVVHESAGRDNHWNESAHGLITALIGHLAANTKNPESRTLTAVRTILRKSKLLELQARAAQEGNDEMVAEELDAFTDLEAAANKAELASIISTARTQTKFLATKAIADSLGEAGFRFRELKEQPTTVYLTLPTRYLATCSKWFRLVVASALDDLLREETGVPVLVILDEFYQLGRLKVIQNAMSLARGYGVQLWPIMQDLTQLQEHYEKSWETFLSSAEVQMFFAPRENTTAKYVSDLGGEATIKMVTTSSGTSENEGRSLFESLKGKSEGYSVSNTQRKVFLPHEVRQLGDSRFLMFAEKAGNIITAYRKPYFSIDEFNGNAGLSQELGRPLYSPDPYHKPAQQRAAAAG